MYKKIAPYYDLLGWDEFHDIALERLKPLLIQHRVKSYLDLACGTGMLACTVARMGIDVVGIDKSKEMLSVAADRLRVFRGPNKPTFLRRDMTYFNLRRQFDAVGCFFDAANHITEPERFASFIDCAAKHVKPGGFFIFDVNTALGLNRWDAVLFTNRGDHAVLMRGSYDRSARFAEITINGFVRLSGGKKDHFKETFYERGYPHKEIMRLLRKNRFADIVAQPQRKGETLKTAGRVFYTAYQRTE